MKTGMPASWTVQEQLEKVREENWRTAGEREREKDGAWRKSWEIMSSWGVFRD